MGDLLVFNMMDAQSVNWVDAKIASRTLTLSLSPNFCALMRSGVHQLQEGSLGMHTSPQCSIKRRKF
jgi:hypothetical protein